MKMFLFDSALLVRHLAKTTPQRIDQFERRMLATVKKIPDHQNTAVGTDPDRAGTAGVSPLSPAVPFSRSVKR